MIKQGILLAPSRIYSRRSMRLSLPLLALLAYSLGIVASLLQGDVHVTRDDGFYYFKIAQNIAGGAGSTFDGLHPTNGYHPLWLLCLVPLFWLTHAPDTALRLGILLEGLLQAVGVGVLYRTARLTCGPFAASFAALLWVWFSYPEALSGIEFSLHALAVLTVAYVYLRWFVHEPPDRPWPYLGLGLLLSLTFLARIDTLLLAVLFWLWLFRQEQRRGFARGSLARLAALALPVAITVLAYAGINIWLFGHPLPVSSLIKRDWSEQLLRSDPQYQAHGWLIAKAHASFWLVHEYREYYAVLLGSVGIGALFLAGERARDGSAWRDWHQRTLRPWGLFVVYSLLQLLSYLIIYHGDLSLRPWYYVIQRWLAALLLADVMEALVNVRRQARQSRQAAAWRRGALGAALALAWCLVPLKTLVNVKRQRELSSPARELMYDAARWIRANLPPDAILGSWNAGTISYLSGRRVVNLDGLVNSWDYYQTGQYDLCRYCRQNGITYLVDTFIDRHALSVIPVYPRYAGCAAPLERVWSCGRAPIYARMEVYRIR